MSDDVLIQQLIARLKDNPNDIDAIYYLGGAEVRAGNFVAATKLYEAAIEKHPEAYLLYQGLGIALMRQKDFHAAITAFEKAILLNTKDAISLYYLGLCYQEIGDFFRAEQFLLKALALEPKSPKILYDLAFVYHAKEKMTDAIASLLAILEVEPNHLSARFLLAQCLLARDLKPEAYAHFEWIAEVAPQNKKALLNIFNCLLSYKCFAEAQIYGEKILLIDKNDHEVLYNLAVAAKESKEIEKAMRYYHQLLESNPRFAAALYNLALLYLAVNQPETAQHYLSLFLREKPKQVAAQYLLDALSGRQSFEAAPKEYLEELFNYYADHFEEHLEELGYQTPQLLRERFNKIVTEIRESDCTVLDLGCGTGLSGVAFRSFAKKMIGVDVSAQMIERAKEKKCYDELIVTENTEYLQKQNQTFNLILAADVFVYQGELSYIFECVYAALKSNGYFIFSVETLEGPENFHLQETGRFAHSEAYVTRIAQNLGFTSKDVFACTLRAQAGQGMPGTVFIFQKSG